MAKTKSSTTGKSGRGRPRTSESREIELAVTLLDACEGRATIVDGDPIDDNVSGVEMRLFSDRERDLARATQLACAYTRQKADDPVIVDMQAVIATYTAMYPPRIYENESGELQSPGDHKEGAHKAALYAVEDALKVIGIKKITPKQIRRWDDQHQDWDRYGYRITLA